MCGTDIPVYSHHPTHAANAFLTSKFSEAIIFTVDAGGNYALPVNKDGKSYSFIIPETLGVFYAKGDESSLLLEKINKTTYVDSSLIEYSSRLGDSFSYIPFNLGMLWNNTTKEVFGLSIHYPKGNQAGTVMAMATMGSPKYKHLFDDTHMMNNCHSHPHPNYDKLKEIASKSEQDGFDVAASLQEFTEDLFFSVMEQHLEDNRHIQNLCFSGGVSLNCVMLAKVKKRFPWIKNVFCDPVPYDGGLSIGAARMLYHVGHKKAKISNNAKNLSPYLGVSYSLEQINSAIENNKEKLVTKNCDKKEVANLLAQEKIVAVYGGGAESGRRALGNRSILADPRSPTMKDTINAKVKHRQWYRPFAPSILLEHTEEWFEDFYYSPYMSFAPKFKEEKRDLVPAVVHFDGTGRLQTVDKEISPWYHSFIEEWYKISGVPLVLNTSFNDREPIVETPEHAVNCFLRTNIDYLYFYEYDLLVEKTK